MVLELLEAVPYSTFFAIFLASAQAFATTLLNSRIVDRRLLAELRRELAEWSAEMELAKKSGDKKLMAKLKKHEVRIMQIRNKISSQQMKVMVITVIPIMLIWWMLTPILAKPSAYISLFGARTEIPFFFWFLICSFFFNFIFSKIFNVEMGMGT